MREEEKWKEGGITWGMVNCMLLCPLQTHTSPNSTSERVMFPRVPEVAVIWKGVTSVVAGSVTSQRHMVPASGCVGKESMGAENFVDYYRMQNNVN